MIFSSQSLMGESINRMACDLFRALDFRDLGYNEFAGKLEVRIPKELTQRGINKAQVENVVLSAATIVYDALYDLTDQRLALFTEGSI